MPARNAKFEPDRFWSDPMACPDGQNWQVMFTGSNSCTGHAPGTYGVRVKAS